MSDTIDGNGVCGNSLDGTESVGTNTMNDIFEILPKFSLHKIYPSKIYRLSGITRGVASCDLIYNTIIANNISLYYSVVIFF